MLRIFFVIFSGLLAIWSISAADLQIRPHEYRSLYKHTQWFEDKNHDFTWSDIQKTKDNELFNRTLSDNLNLGFTESQVWMKFTVTSIAHKHEKYVLMFDFAPLDRIDLYEPTGQQYTMRTAGDLVPMSQWDMSHRNPVFILDLPPQIEQTYYVRIKTESAMVAPVTLTGIESFYEKDRYYIYFYGFFYGIIAVMFFYNLFLYFSLREPVTLRYVVYIGFFGFYMVIYRGQGFEMFWPENVWFNEFANPVFLSIVAMTAIEFSRKYLNLRLYAPLTDLLLFGFSFTFNFAIISAFWVEYSFIIKMNNIMIIIASSMIIYGSIVSFKKKNPLAKYFIAAFGGFILTAIIVILRNMALLPSNLFTVMAIQVGAMAEVVLLSFGLAYRINLMRKDREKQKEKLSNIQSDMELASRLQHSILPDKLPNNERIVILAQYMPMESIGGDYYDYHFKKNKLGIFIADVTGHGVASALYASMLKMAFANEKPLMEKPARLMQNINDNMSEKATSHFLTASYLYIDFDRMKATYVSCGHPPLFYYNNKTEEIEEIKPRGRALGLDSDLKIEEYRFQLSLSDRLFMYTDGLSELVSPDHEFLGTEGIKEWLYESLDSSAHNMTEFLTDKLSEYTGQKEVYDDDITYLIIDIK